MNERERGYEIVYQEALRAISDQQDVLDSIQSRTGVVASAAAIVLSLTSQRALGLGLSVPLWVALGAFLLLASLAGYVLWPRRRWRFHFGVERLHAEYVENVQPLTPGLMMRDLALHLDRYFRLNARAIDRISKAFAGSLLALMVQAMAFSYDVFGGM